MKIIRQRKNKKTTHRFRDLKIGASLVIECNDYTAPHGFAKAAGIKVKTERSKNQPSKGFRIKCTRIE